MNKKMMALLYAHSKYLAGDLSAPSLDLRGANLAKLSFRNMDLSHANFSRANLWGCDLRGTNFTGANLSAANLHRCKLKGANFTNAILSRAFLAFVALDGVDLTGTDLWGANLEGVQWPGVIMNDTADMRLQLARVRMIGEGDIIGWKKLRGNRIAKLLVPKRARRSNGFSRKCRAEWVITLSIIDGHGKPHNQGSSRRDSSLKYIVGKETHADSWDEDWKNECSHGINFFATYEEAEAY